MSVTHLRGLGFGPGSVDFCRLWGFAVLRDDVLQPRPASPGRFFGYLSCIYYSPVKSSTLQYYEFWDNHLITLNGMCTAFDSLHLPNPHLCGLGFGPSTEDFCCLHYYNIMNWGRGGGGGGANV
jgi:hypothetical protein